MWVNTTLALSVLLEIYVEDISVSTQHQQQRIVSPAAKKDDHHATVGSICQH